MRYLPWLLVFSLLGCGPSKTNTGVEKGLAPKSHVSYEDGLSVARTFALIVGGKVSKIAPTGSMEPIVDSSSIAVFMSSEGVEIKPGMVVSYTREGKNNVMHRVLAVSGDEFIPAGITNSRNDGRIKLDRIEKVLIGVIYTAGQ